MVRVRPAHRWGVLLVVVRSTVVHLVLTALVDGMRARPGYRDWRTRGSEIPVYDGPEVEDGDDRPGTLLVVGYGGELDDAIDDSAGGEVSVRAMSPASPKEEVGEVECLAVVASGDKDVRGVRAAAVAVMDDVDDLLRSDPRLGIPTDARGQIIHVQLIQWRLQQYSDEGAIAELRFTHRFTART